MYNLLVPLILTIVIEIICLLLLQKDDKIILTSVLLNIVTNLTLNFILHFVLDSKLIIYISLVVILEACVLIVESLIYNIHLKNIKQAIQLVLVARMKSKE
jgi:hypothetical protein